MLASFGGDSGALVIMIVGYLDESGTHAQARAVAVAGYLARWEDWQKFRKGWRRLLRRYEVSDFHMKDAAHFRNDFENWEPSRRDKFLSDAAQMIKRHTLVAFGCGFVVADYDANEEVDKYFLCLHGAIHFLLANMNRERPPIKLRFGENISFVFDQKPGFEGAAEKVFAHLRARHVLGERLLGKIRFSTRTICPPLQAADFFAYETAKSLGDRRYDSARPPRRSLLALLQDHRLLFFQPRAAFLRAISANLKHS